MTRQMTILLGRVDPILTFALVPSLGEPVEDLRDLAVVFVLVDCSQVCHHQIGHAQSLRPSAAHLDCGEVNLLALRVAELSRVGEERWQLVSEVHGHGGVLLLQRA